MFHNTPVLVLALGIGIGIGQYYWALGALLSIVLTLTYKFLENWSTYKQESLANANVKRATAVHV